MFKFFKKRWSANAKPTEPPQGDEWITVPFRFVETARVSIHTIGKQQEIPQHVRWWIAQWLATFNDHLIAYMQENYGPDIFPLLDKITEDVVPKGPPSDSDSWYRWEMQLGGEHGD